jgi:hypothetical protein
MTSPNAICWSPTRAPRCAVVRSMASANRRRPVAPRTLDQPLTLVWIGVRASMSMVAALATGRLGGSK